MRTFHPTQSVWGFGIALLSGWIAVLKFGLTWVFSTQFNSVPMGDFGMGALGWLFFRSDAWRLPPGVMHSFYYPVGASVGNTDSIPWFAVFFKLFSPILPQTFQYFGLWVFLTYFLQGASAFWLASLLFRDRVLRILVAGFFIFSAPFFYRAGHLALSAHWILLVCLGLAVQITRGEIGARRTRGVLLALNAICAGVHPYLLMMTLSFSVFWAARWALSYRLWRQRLLVALRESALQTIVPFGLLVAFGYFWFNGTTDGGFGFYGADLLSFLNPLDASSRFFRSIRATGGQYEGMAYLGAGMFLLIPVAILGLVRAPTRVWQKGHSYRWVWGWVLALFVYCLSSEIRFGGNLILRLDIIYRWFTPITGSFRASGRFIWPAFYALVAYSLVLVTHRVGVARARWILAAALCVQILDLTPLYWRANPLGNSASADVTSIFGVGSQSVLRAGDLLHITPPMLIADLMECNPGREAWDPTEINRLFLAAGLNRMRINGGAVSRGPTERVRAYCKDLWSDLRSKQWREGSLYLLTPTTVRTLGWSTPPSGCWRGGPYWLCRAGGKD